MTAGAGPARTPREEEIGRALLARHLLRRGREALKEAEELLSKRRLRGAIHRAVDATLAGARALLAPRGLDCPEIAAATALFDRQLVASEVVSRACGLALHRALRARREMEEGDFPVLYAARVDAVRDGAAGLLAEVDIVLERLLADIPPAPPPGAAEGAADDDEI